ncbi:hypothetical protein [Paenibacillus sp. L3-i20]|uniref:hypothetical protein n=1 Tax=Paenibacillus sp. L3-i20 TaxID=2905833 RepID=UPI001EDEE462|nr:hypothetical protein [Paenibacillus sp. L3-i20]GKU77555.1 hypothetical protein L3i20_v219520 [Paenibacillus sp. L3-i20]
MLTVIGILIVSTWIAFIEVPALKRKHQIKELWIFSILLLLGTALSIAESSHVKMPSPLDWIMKLYMPISELLNGVLI